MGNIAMEISGEMHRVQPCRAIGDAIPGVRWAADEDAASAAGKVLTVDSCSSRSLDDRLYSYCTSSSLAYSVEFTR